MWQVAFGVPSTRHQCFHTALLLFIQNAYMARTSMGHVCSKVLATYHSTLLLIATDGRTQQASSWRHTFNYPFFLGRDQWNRLQTQEEPRHIWVPGVSLPPGPKAAQGLLRAPDSHKQTKFNCEVMETHAGPCWWIQPNVNIQRLVEIVPDIMSIQGPGNSNQKYIKYWPHLVSPVTKWGPTA